MRGGRRKSEKWGRANDYHNVNMILHNMNLEEKGTMFFRDPMEHLIELLLFNFLKKKKKRTEKKRKKRKKSVGMLEINFTETQKHHRLPFVVLFSGHSNPLSINSEN